MLSDPCCVLHSHRVRPWCLRNASPEPHATALMSRPRSKSTPEVARAIFDYGMKQAHTAVFGGSALWGRPAPRLS